MAKESLREYLNRKIKGKGSSLSKEKKKASKYKSISAAKKAGALYYTNKDGKVMAAVFAEDLKEKLGSPPPEKITVSNLEEGGRGDGVNELMKRNRKATLEERARKKAKKDFDAKGPKTEKNVGAAKGGMMTKKSTGYNKGGMPMVMKDGKKVPAYAADGVGKMNKGGVAKKKPAAKMMAGGMAKKKPAAKMMGGGMAKKSSGYMYGGMTKKKK